MLYLPQLNQGFVAAQNVEVKVIYPRYVIPISSTTPWTSRRDSVLTFNVGTLATGESRSFTITDSVMCGDEPIRGLTQCTKAIISPASSCLTADSRWNKASLALSAACAQGGIARLTLHNTGTGDMSEATEYRIFMDGVLKSKATVKLKADEKPDIEVNAQGRTVRLEAGQPAFHPGNSKPNVTPERCNVVVSTSAASSFLQLPPDNGNEFENTSCMPIRDSYDPNDKQVVPSGVTDQNLTKENQRMEYLVRFQNTGNDVAYKIVIRDTISEHLDIGSLKNEVASHTYSYKIDGWKNGQTIITWTFDNINLPDNKSNEPGSHGFVKFRSKTLVQEKMCSSGR